jgi:hypothetical protein
VFDCTRSLVCELEKAHKHSHYRYRRNIDIPCAMVLTAYIVRAPVRPAFVSPSLAHHRGASLAPATRAPRARFPKLAHPCGEFLLASFGKQGARANLAFQCRLRFEVPVLDSRQSLQELQIGGTGPTRLCRPRANVNRRMTCRVHRIPRSTCRDDRDTPLFIEAGCPDQCIHFPKNGREIFFEKSAILLDTRFFAEQANHFERTGQFCETLSPARTPPTCARSKPPHQLAREHGGRISIQL